MSSVALFADGGSRGNPGESAYGFAVYVFENEQLTEKEVLELCSSISPEVIKGEYIGLTTNNVAEWSGVKKGVEFCNKNYGANRTIFIFLDSQLVVRQVLGEYKVKQPHLIPYHSEVKNLLAEYSKWSIHHIYREQNKIADSEVNRILDSIHKN